MKIGEAIKNYLNNHGITQAFVSNDTGIPCSALSEMLNDKRTMSLERFISICKAIHQKPSRFIDEVNHEI